MKRLLTMLLVAAAFAVAGAAGAFAGGSGGTGTTSAGCADGSVSASPAVLWPPNHKLVTIGIDYNQPPDDFGGSQPTSVTVNSITASQGSASIGVGNVGNGNELGPDATTTVQLTAERSGTIQAGQTYDINVTCNDDGEIGTADLTITVPHDQGN